MDAAEAKRRRGQSRGQSRGQTEGQARGGSNPALQMAMLRRWHVYLSVFVAPSLIFFALTGVLQTFRIPDRPDAPVLIQKLARVHKDDVFAVRPPRPPRPDSAGGGRGGARGGEREAGMSGRGRHARGPDGEGAGEGAGEGSVGQGAARAGAAGPGASEAEASGARGSKAPGPGAFRQRPKAKPSTEAAKWFFAAASVVIAATTLLGLWMALAYSRQKAVTWALLIAGALIPVVILAL